MRGAGGAGRGGKATAEKEQASLPFARYEPAIDEGERWAEARGYLHVIGVDEVGRGPLAGPVVAAAVWLPKDLQTRIMEEGLDDSKRLSPSSRQRLASILEAEAAYAVGIVGPGRVDEINILRASFEAMTLAVREVGLAITELGSAADLLLVDGGSRIEPHPLPGVRQHALVKGDRRSLAIAAASVIAKVRRDAIMTKYHEAYPEYGFADHKGYPSPTHIEAIRRFGPSPIHRMSFKGVMCPEPEEGKELL